MQIGKKTTYIFNENIKFRETSIPDTLREALGRYWVAGRAGLILCGLYGEDPKILEQLVVYNLMVQQI